MWFHFFHGLVADGFLLGGILIMYELHNLLRYILLFFYSFWIPQIVANVVRDSRKPLHPHYILGMTVTRLAIPLYAFGCPKNFMRIETNVWWCLGLTAFLGAQAGVLLLQHYFGARCFVPRQVQPFEFVRFRTSSQIWLDPLWMNFQMFNIPTYGMIDIQFWSTKAPFTLREVESKRLISLKKETFSLVGSLLRILVCSNPLYI